MSLNTTPRTWVSSEVVTATQLNTEIRDALTGIQAAWTSYGSGSSWTASVSNPAIGNGTWAGAYLQVGKTILFRVTVTMGSTTTYGSGTWRIALPVTAKSGVRWRVHTECVDAGVNAYSGYGVTDVAATYVSLFRIGGTSADSAITSAAPFTWGSTDILTVQGSYEAA